MRDDPKLIARKPDTADLDSFEALQKRFAGVKASTFRRLGSGAVKISIYRDLKKLAEAHLIKPTFITEYPAGDLPAGASWRSVNGNHRPLWLAFIGGRGKSVTAFSSE